MQHKILIWGTGREGRAAYKLLSQRHDDSAIAFIDDAAGEESINLDNVSVPVLRKPDTINNALSLADIVVKSPGVSLYHPAIQSFVARGGTLSSLLNLWLEQLSADKKTVAVTGTKGKSTSCSLLHHVLRALGVRAELIGNIGRPVTEADKDAELFIVEVSSYQAASLQGRFDIGLLTSLYPCHIDWHRTLAAYYRDKLNLFAHVDLPIINADFINIVTQHCAVPTQQMTLFNTASSIHVRDGNIWHNDRKLGVPDNAHLARPHNLSNVAGVLSVLVSLGYDPVTAVHAMDSYQGLAHRQEEIGTRAGILYVNDSIATTPAATIAALNAYRDTNVSLIVGGISSGLDYETLHDAITRMQNIAVIGLGVVGDGLVKSLSQQGIKAQMAQSMEEAVAKARDSLPQGGGVVLLSPGAQSFDMFRNFEHRGDVFRQAAGFAKVDRLFQPSLNCRAP